MNVVFVILVAAAVISSSGGFDVPAASPAPVSSASASPAASIPPASATPSPLPIVPPHDAPPARMTTPPFTLAPVITVPQIPDSIWMEASNSIAVPIAVHRNRPYVDVILNGHPATFLIDTSVVTTLVDPHALNELVNRSTVSLQINGLRFTHLATQLANVHSFTETNLGVAADGIIGNDLLSRYPIQFDFPNRILTIYRNSASAAIAMPKTAVSAPMRIIDGRPAVEATLDGDQGLWFSLSTGAGFQMQLNPASDHASRLGGQLTLPFEETTDRGRIGGRLARAQAMVLGGVTFYQPLVAILDMERPGSELAGALGAYMLSRLNVLIDESTSNVSFVAGPNATSAFLYDPSGVTLVWRHGAIVVQSVIPNSPADAEHLKPGDEILSINGLAPATLDFARQLLDGSPGSKVAVAYRRWGIRRSATLTLRVLI